MKKCFFCFFFTPLFLVILFASDTKTIISQKLTRINYSAHEIDLIVQQTNLLIKNSLPESLVLKLVNEAVIKKIPFVKFYPVLEKYVSSAILAKNLIEKIKTPKFQPKDYIYCITTLTELINSGVTQEEYIKLMTLLSNNYTFDDATVMLNYYLAFRRFFRSPVVDENNNVISTPYEVLFLKYYTRPPKELSMIIQSIERYFSICHDVNEIYNLLFSKAQMSTEKLVKNIKALCDQKVKQEIKREIEQDKSINSKHQRL